MTETASRPPAPRIEAETLPAPRLEALAVAVPRPARRRAGMLSLTLAGIATLIGGGAALETVFLVEDAFARSPLAGAAAAFVALTGASLVTIGIGRELRGLFLLHRVDRLRAGLSSPSPVRLAAAARRWARTLPEGATLLPAIDAINDPDAILALLRSGPDAALRAQAESLGRNAALQALAGIAAMPGAGLAALFVAWRGLRLIRQIAALYGLRPGLLGTLALVRRTAIAAGAVAGAELAANAAAHAALSSPLLAHLAGDIAGAAVGARRMTVLARATAAACSPITPPRDF